MKIKARIIILVILLILIVGGGIFLYLVLSGKLKIGAEMVVGCQNSKRISAFFGRPGTHLGSYNFFGHEITVNEMVVPFLDKVQDEIKAAKIDYGFNDAQGYNLRSKSRGGGLSLHSWGIAIDINPEANPYQRGNYGPAQTDMPAEVIEIFRRHGFFWGGDWPGERDPMHFEWYGASLSGVVLDHTNKQKILSAATAVDGSGSPNNEGEFYWIVPAGDHEISAIGRGYKENKFPISLGCFSQDSMAITLEPLPSNVPGSVSGKVRVAGNYPLLVPANIFLDGRLVGVSSLRGDYLIPNIREGKHKIEGKIMFFPGDGTEVEVVPGDSLKNVNILIGG